MAIRESQKLRQRKRDFATIAETFQSCLASMRKR